MYIQMHTIPLPLSLSPHLLQIEQHSCLSLSHHHLLLLSRRLQARSQIPLYLLLICLLQVSSYPQPAIGHPQVSSHLWVLNPQTFSLLNNNYAKSYVQ